MRKSMTLLALLALAAGMTSCDTGGVGGGDLSALREPVATIRGGEGGVHLPERRRPKAAAEIVSLGDDGRIAGEGPFEIETGPGTFGLKPIDRPELYRARPGDVLLIELLGEDKMSRKVKVGPDGRLTYYIARGIQASGRTFDHIRRDIAHRLRAHYKNPQIAVSGISYRGNTVSVLGVVGKPGLYEITSSTRLLDVIAQAGGIPVTWKIGATSVGTEEIADYRKSYVMRGGEFLDVDFVALFRGTKSEVVGNNALLRPGDRVNIPAAAGGGSKVMVLGEVARPGVVRYANSISFLEAIAEAGGVKASAWERKAFIVRGSMDRPKVMAVNARAVATGRSRDVELQRGDVVFLPKHALGKMSEVTRQLVPLMIGAAATDHVTRH